MRYGLGIYGLGVYGAPLFANYPESGGIPIADDPTPGGLVTAPGQLQFGQMLLGGETRAGWRELVNWRALPDAQVADSQRPQAHGSYPGSVFGDSLTVTFTYLVRGKPDAKQAAIDTIERYTPMDGVERPLVVNDGSGAWMRMARVIARDVPQDHQYRYGPLECSIQFLCADPRRYSTTERGGVVKLPESSGGLAYPLVYPLGYGDSSSGGLVVTNDGTLPSPITATFFGPLTNPVLTADGWRLGFDLPIADGETLTVDTSAGTALLNGTADRLYTITPASDPLERVLLQPGDTNLILTAEAGGGHMSIAYRDARM